jgi:hypothetical protein
MATADLESKEIWGEAGDGVDADILALSAEEIRQRTSMLNNNIRVMRSELNNIDNDIK